jgi:outer membrane protein TolC
MKIRPLVYLTLLFGSFAAVQSSAFAGDVVSWATKQGSGAIQRRGQLSGDVSLLEAVNVALRQNPEVLKALREVERVHGQVIELRAQALPHLALTTGFDHVEPPLVSQSAAYFTQNNTWRIALEVRQVLYSGGQVAASIQAAQLRRDAAVFTVRDVVDRVVGLVRKEFYQVLATRSLIGVAEESVELASQQLNDARNRFDAGTVPRFNVLRAEVELASVKPSLIRAKNDHLIAQLQIAKTLGLDAAPGGKPTFQCVGEMRITDDLMGLADALGVARARRASLKAQRQQILIEKEQMVIALAGFKPRIDARGGYEIMNKRMSRDIDDAVNGYFLGVTGSWKIFDGFETKGQVSQAKARMESAVVAYDDAVQTVELEVQRAHADLRQFRETIESQQKNVQQALEALRLSQERLSAGAGTQLEVLDARVALTRARTTELQARADYMRSLAEFDRATAANTVYTDSFKDPLSILEKRAPRAVLDQLFRP